MNINVVKRDGTTAPYDPQHIARSLEEAAAGLPDADAKVAQLVDEFAITLYDGVTTTGIDEAAVQVAIQNVKDDPDFDTIAARLLLKKLYKNALGSYTSFNDLASRHGDRFAGYIEAAVGMGVLDTRLLDFDLERLGQALRPERDSLLEYIAVTTLANRYAITDANRVPMETPQFFWMRTAMGLSLNEENKTDMAIAFYEKISKLEYLPAGSTLVNAGTSHPQLSNCFVIDMEDDIDHIFHTISNVGKITKGTGGIGLSATKLRSKGSLIKSNNTTSTGPIPFLHTIDSTLRAISRGGKKFGALAIYMENWHLDFGDFLDLRANNGDPYRRTRTANTAVWLSDEFMHRIEDDNDWYLFDPADVSDLTELYGQEFSKRYAEYIADAEAGRIKRFKKVKAREQWNQILQTLRATSHPWLTWKDAINVRALNNNTGTIHLSNLCTEITLPQDRDNISVCNLASVNLSTHLVDGEINWDTLATSTRLALRQLDNLIDITLSTVPESERSNEQNRAVGLGVMGFQEVIERLGIPYESKDSYAFADKVFEFISWHAIDESADLARTRGSYPNFDGSGWSKGMVPIDTIQRLEDNREVAVSVLRTARMDWDTLREKVKGGIRNATVMAVAPTATIGLVAGTTPGLDPRFAQLFSRTTSNGKFLEVNRNLVRDLKKLGMWEDVREDLLIAQGDLDQIPGIPDHIRKVYQTSFNLSPKAFIEVAARAQKWVDQAISRNMYLQRQDDKDANNAYMDDVYRTAWKMGVKTTYYLHMQQRHTAEQSTTKVNKSLNLQSAGGNGATSGARPSGFGGFGAKRPQAPASTVPAQPVEALPAPQPVVSEVTPVAQAPKAPSAPARPGGFGGFGAKGFKAPTPAQRAAAPAPAQQAAPVEETTPAPAAEQPKPRFSVPTLSGVAPDQVACPTDPAELLACDSCQ